MSRNLYMLPVLQITNSKNTSISDQNKERSPGKEKNIHNKIINFNKKISKQKKEKVITNKAKNCCFVYRMNHLHFLESVLNSR